MKRINNVIALLATIVAFSACVKEESAPVFEEKTIHFYANSIDTKTAFGTPNEGTYPTLWTSKDSKIKISLNYDSPEDAAVTPSLDFKTASFTASIEDDQSGAYTFYAMSPASAFLGNSTQNKYLSATIPVSQTPTATSVDEAAQILVAKSSTTEVLPDEVAFDFTHMTAYGRLTLKNLELGEAVVSSIALTSSVPFAGRWNYYYETGNAGANSASETITINTSSVSDVWFACAPVEMSEATLTVVVNTDKGTFTKEVNVPENTSFEPGVISVINVNMQGVELVSPKVYELVTDVASLTNGSEVVIVAKTADFAISTTQNSNNRATAAINKENNIIKSPGGDVEVFTIRSLVENTYSFYTEDGYIYAASSSSNNLKTESTLSENSTWSVSIESDGSATIQAKGANTRNLLKYNSTSNVFSCYASGQSEVQIYKLKDSGSSTGFLKVSDIDFSVPAATTTTSISIVSDLAWSISSDDVTVSPSSGSGNQTVTVNLSANSSSSVVVNELVVTSGEISIPIKIRQEGKELTYRKASSITSGKSYLIVSNNKVAGSVSGNYSYLSSTEVTIENDEIVMSGLSEFTFESVTGGYKIKQTDGRYLYSYNSGNQKINASSSPSSAEIWTITISEGNATIKNVANENYITYSSQYKNFSLTSDSGTVELYELQSE